MEAIVGSRRSLRSHPTLALPYFAGEGTYPGEREVHAIEACMLVVGVCEPQRRHAGGSRCWGSHTLTANLRGITLRP